MVLAFAFTISWTATSLVAGETQSAGMGLLIFGSISVILLIAMIRVAGKNLGKDMAQLNMYAQTDELTGL